MTLPLTELHRRDHRIDELTALGADRTRRENIELSDLHNRRALYWARFPHMVADVRRRAAELEAYARQHRLPIEDAA